MLSEEIPSLSEAPIEHLIVVYSQVGGVGQTTVAVNLADTLARHGQAVLLLDWDVHGAVAASFGILPTRGLHDWIMNGAPGGSRLGYDRFIQATPLPGLWVMSGYLPLLDVSTEVIHGHLSELVWASKFDYVVCDVALRQDGLAERLLPLRPGTVIIPVALDNMNMAHVRAAFERVQALTPDAQLILQPTFFHPRWKITIANLDLLKNTYPGSVMEPIAYRPALRIGRSTGQTIYQQDRNSDLLPVFTQLTRWIQSGPDEILFGA